ncbi:hypothetical protein DESUT3_36770 [Desulfuromonas versatilis]|uniref:Flagellar protein FlgJ N-terminal domain-containing protein n=1 Tax=Desulfuromonas versatilis TaxID=2802975 RepID=A0ABN6E2P4_9BACT|nr:rod-binding protein [Desulfuromonas versatilis]BCR06608.1 hypothetical protein DESUT3_36770 [Desulfuromonas versatilis]
MKLHSIDPSLLVGQSQNVDAKNLKKDDPEALRKTCQEFEAIFIQQMFKGMRQTLPQGGVLEKSSAQEMFEEMRDIEVARDAASQGKFGIGEALFRQLVELDVDKADAGDPETEK